MNRLRATKSLFAGAALLMASAAAGCGGSGYELAPVSGIVTMEGAPLANSTVVFEPVATAGSEESGPASSGRTDAAGHFELKLADGSPGAVVGRHRVRIWPEDTAGGTGEGDSVDNDVSAADAGDSERHEDEQEEESDVMDYSQTPEDMIPARYNVRTTLTETVPEGGSDTVRFALTR